MSDSLSPARPRAPIELDDGTRATGDPSLSSPPAPADRPPAAPARILIVEADGSAARALADAVTGLGHAVCGTLSAGPPPDALPADARPDLALVGLGRGRDAPAVIEAAEQVVAQCGVPILYVTEGLDGGLLERAQRTVPLGYVLKPVDARQLHMSIVAATSVAARGRSAAERIAELEAQAAAAMESRGILKSLFDSMSDAVIATDLQGNYLAVNPATGRLYPTSDGSSDPRSWAERYEVLEADGRTPFRWQDLPLMRAQRGEETDDVVLLLRSRRPRPDDSGIWLSASGRPVLDEANRRTGAVVVMRNVTAERERAAVAKQLQAELHERMQVLDAIIHSMSDGVVVADAQGRLTLLNPSGERIVGMGLTDSGPEEWPAIYGFFHTDRETLVTTEELPLVRAIQGRTIADEQLFVRNPKLPDGAYISVNANPVRDRDGQLTGGVAVFRDVTQRRLAEEALTQAFAHGRLEVLDTILHNIGNAINSVAVGVDTLRTRFNEDTLVRRFEALAEEVARHEDDWISWLRDDPRGRQVRPFLLALVEDLMREGEESRRTAERVSRRVHHIVDIIRTQESFTDATVERKCVNLRRAVGDAVRVLDESFKRRGIDVEVDCARAPEEFFVQESRFHQMLVNLLKNAVESMDELAAGPAAARGRRPCVRVAAYRAEGVLVIDVIDNGIGIDASQFRAMFNAGYTSKATGRGLGLHSAANFVIAAGGSIQPLSAGIGHGATMRVKLRLAEPAASPGGEG